MIDFTKLSKKGLAFGIILALVILGALAADITLVVQTLENWRTVVSAVALTGAAVGGVWGLWAYLKKQAGEQS